VWALGLVSLFMDLSSEVVHSLLPVFLVGGLGLGVAAVGVIEGIAEATASITKAFSGAVSDWVGRRKPLVVAGYALAAATKPLFPLAQGLSLVLAARFLDRFGKGVRGAPRDALIADVTPAAVRGAAYGMRQALDTVGALFGPLAAAGLMVVLADDIRAVYWIAVVPALLSVVILVALVREPERPSAAAAGRARLRLADVRQLNGTVWAFLGIVLALSAGRLGEAFLILRGTDTGLPVAAAPLVLATMSAAYALSSYPAGRLSDRIGRARLVAGGFMLLVLANALLAMAQAPVVVFAGALLWGVHMGATQGVLAAMVADVAPERLRGTAFGLFHCAVGVAMLGSGMAAGVLWQAFGAAVAFAAATVVAALATAAFVVWRLGRPRS
jgi:MFS family permease